MSETTKLILAVFGVIITGFVMVGLNKQQSKEEIQASSQIRTYVAMQEMANKKCPQAIKQETGEQVFFPSETDSDKETYVTMKWVGETEKSAFKTATCTLSATLGGISKLVIDDKVIIEKK
ncbi:MAG: hypothetical protein CTY18_08540 [Methylomonas sp.]|nr:MAG: hypothetical protein CTY24_04420 [Methylobacter sp.]PPD34329.1 MAG: hypothetical protein CTY18_08540 [Methylomonas sp.]